MRQQTNKFSHLTAIDRTKLSSPACWLMANKVQQLLTREFQPDGFNVGMNINPAAGQAMNHATIHIIPRYHGDTDRPKSGIRSILPKTKGTH